MKQRTVKGIHNKTGETVTLALTDCHGKGYDPRLVKACCNGRRKHYAGYTWEWSILPPE